MKMEWLKELENPTLVDDECRYRFCGVSFCHSLPLFFPLPLLLFLSLSLSLSLLLACLLSVESAKHTASILTTNLNLHFDIWLTLSTLVHPERKQSRKAIGAWDLWQPWPGLDCAPGTKSLDIRSHSRSRTMM